MGLLQTAGWPSLYPWCSASSAATVFTTTNFGAAGMVVSTDKEAFMFQAPRTGSLKAFGWRVGTVTQNPVNGLTVSFQDIDATNGLPDGVVDQSRNVPTGSIASNTWVTTGIISSDGTDTGALRAVTQGDFVSAVIAFTTFVAGDSLTNNKHVSDPYNTAPSAGVPWMANNRATIWAKDTRIGPGIFAVQYSDGIWYPIHGAIPFSATTTTTFAAASAADEIGMKFVAPADLRVLGFYFYGSYVTAATSTYKLHLYDSATKNVLTLTGDPDLSRVVNSATLQVRMGASSPVIKGGETYRVTLEATGAGNLTISEYQPATVAFNTAGPWGEFAEKTSRADAGAWTDTTNGTAVCIGLLVDGIVVPTVQHGRGR